MVTKTIANRIKLHMDKIFNPNQSAFIPNRLITDNIILVYEYFHILHKNKSKNKGYVGFKHDMAKTYDMIE